MKGTFPPSPNRETAKQALRKGMSPEECAVKFDISTRTAYRYLKEIRSEVGQGKLPQPRQVGIAPVKISIEMSSQDFAKVLDIVTNYKIKEEGKQWYRE